MSLVSCAESIGLSGILLKGKALELLVAPSSSQEPHAIDWAQVNSMAARMLCAFFLIVIVFYIIRRRLGFGQRTANLMESTVQFKRSKDIWRYLKEIPIVEEWKEENCSICLEPFEDIVSQAPCGHVFHKKCIREWLLNTKKDCPNCRSKVYASPPPSTKSYEASELNWNSEVEMSVVVLDSQEAIDDEPDSR